MSTYPFQVPSGINIVPDISGNNSLGTALKPFNGIFLTSMNGALVKQAAFNEIPSGNFLSGNSTFVLSNTPFSGTTSVFLNGLITRPTTDYTFSGSTFTMTVAPASGSWIMVDYLY